MGPANACGLAQFCRAGLVLAVAVAPLSMGMDLWEESHKLLHPPGGKAVGFGGLPWGRDSFLAPCPLLSPSCNVALQVSEKEAGKSAEEEGGEEGGHAGEEPAAR